MHRAINAKLAGLGVVVLALASGAAQADVSSTVTVATDYDFRGITQTGLGPAFQASLDWSGESGLYAGLWGSNIDFGNDVDLNIEVDALLGYAGSFTEDFGYDVGATYYKYLGDDTNGDNDVDYYEIHGGLNYTEHASTTVWYAPDYGNSGESAWYAELNGDVPLPWELGVALHGGYSGGDYWKDADLGGDQFYDFSVGLTRSFGRFDFALKYVDGSDNKDYDCSRSSVECGGDAIFSSQSKVVFSIATTFPWSKPAE